MKTLGICAMIALAALSAAPVMAAGPMQDKAVALAAPASKASISTISYALFQAVAESPSDAHVSFAKVLAQRENWTAGEVYALLRAVLMAHPELRRAYDEYTKNDEPVAPEQGVDAAGAAGDAEETLPTVGGALGSHPMFVRLMEVLANATLPDGVARDAVNGLAANVVDLVQINQSVVGGVAGGATDYNKELEEPRRPEEALEPLVPSPAPMSPQN